MHRRFLGAGLVVALAVAATTAAPALADSIVYIKGGNVWTIRPDGRFPRQVTRNGTPA